ncbi:GXWXG domain-containing protein [Pararhizobium sp. PWRC1-1]|uniref:GXWXG domain-containing protein n=1 Tax=Pararhizobium sp. PWRC1-1 TaxID=2804566 RepID=UPI003CE83C49
MTVDLQKAKQKWFQTLQPLRPAEMVGLWSGVGIPAGHPLDGVLENLQWFGKRFHADLRADALLFQWRPGRLVPINPAYFPIGMAIRLAPFGRTAIARNWFSHLQKAVRARNTTAALTVRDMDVGETVAMVYDNQPIIDYFRRIDEREIAGMMCVAGDDRRYFFRLRKVDPTERENPF